MLSELEMCHRRNVIYKLNFTNNNCRGRRAGLPQPLASRLKQIIQGAHGEIVSGKFVNQTRALRAIAVGGATDPRKHAAFAGNALAMTGPKPL